MQCPTALESSLKILRNIWKRLINLKWHFFFSFPFSIKNLYLWWQLGRRCTALHCTTYSRCRRWPILRYSYTLTLFDTVEFGYCASTVQLCLHNPEWWWVGVGGREGWHLSWIHVTLTSAISLSQEYHMQTNAFKRNQITQQRCLFLSRSWVDNNQFNLQYRCILPM